MPREAEQIDDNNNNNNNNDVATIVFEKGITASEKKSSIMEDQPQKRSRFERIRTPGIFIGIILSMFVMSLNSTVVAPAMSIIATELQALEQQTWIATSFMVAMVINFFFEFQQTFHYY